MCRTNTYGTTVSIGYLKRVMGYIFGPHTDTQNIEIVISKIIGDFKFIFQETYWGLLSLFQVIILTGFSLVKFSFKDLQSVLKKGYQKSYQIVDQNPCDFRLEFLRRVRLKISSNVHYKIIGDLLNTFNNFT